jgi:hypothetical protein
MFAFEGKQTQANAFAARNPSIALEIRLCTQNADWLRKKKSFRQEAALNFDHFGVVSLRIYDRNDYDRISLFNRGAGGFRRLFAAERTLELPVHL